MKFRMIAKDKSSPAAREFHGFIIEADNTNQALDQLHKLKGVLSYPTSDDYDLVEYSGPGRPKFEKSTKRTFLVPDDLYNKIPGGKAKFIRDAIREKLEGKK